MPSSEALVLTLRDVAVDVVRFPIWWYSRGLERFFSFCVANISGAAQSLSITLWIKNLFVPMYGKYDWQSRLISVFMRSVQIFGRLFAFTVWSFMVLIGFALYLMIPIFIGILFLYYGVGSIIK